MQNTMRGLWWVLLAVCMLLAGCKGRESSVTPATPTTAATQSPSPTATPTPTPKVLEALKGQVILGDYSTLRLSLAVAPVTEEDLTQQLAVLAKRLGLTEITDAVIRKRYPGLETVEQFCEQTAEQIAQARYEEALRDLKRDILEWLIAGAQFDSVVEAKTEEYRMQLLTGYQERAALMGQSFAAFAEQQFGVSEEQLREQIAEEALTVVKGRLCLLGIAELENLQISPDELQAGLEYEAGKAGYSDVDMFEKHFGLDSVRELLLQQKAMDWLLMHVQQE